MAEQAGLAETLIEWIDRMRLEKAELTRLAGIGRQTLYRILDGFPAQAETLRKIAKGLATDPRTGDVDPTVRREALRDFARAAGIDLAEDAPAPSLEGAILAEGVKSPRQAARLADFVRKYPNMADDERKLVDALIDHLGEE